MQLLLGVYSGLFICLTVTLVVAQNYAVALFIGMLWLHGLITCVIAAVTK